MKHAFPSPRAAIGLTGRILTIAFSSLLAAATLMTTATIANASPTPTPTPARIGRHFPGSVIFRFDSDSAVGPRHFVESNNITFKVFNKYTGTLAFDAALFATKMNSVLGTAYTYDPHIRFDQASKRWIATFATEAETTESGLAIGISATDDPTGDWTGFYIKADPGNEFWADFPWLGFDGAGVYLVPTMVALSGDRDLAYLQLYSIPKQDLLASTPTIANLTRLPFTMTGFEPQTDYQSASTDGVMLLRTATEGSSGDYFESGEIQDVLNADGPGASFSALSQILVPLGNINTDFNNAQPGTIETLGIREGAITCVRVGNLLYGVQPDYGGLVWTVRDIASHTAIEGGRIGEPDHVLMDGAIGANERGEIVIAYLRSGPDEFGSAYASVGHPLADGTHAWDPPLLLQAGTDIYDEAGPQWGGNAARYSDYSSSVSVDPQDSGRFWVSNPYISGRNIASTYISELIVSSEATTPPRLLNISTRLRVLNGDSVSIEGFVITGNTPKKVIVRALGLSLAGFGVPDALADPILELHEPDGTVITNDNWKDSQQAEIEATKLAPTQDLESAIIATLSPGEYTAVLRGKNGGVGTGLIEAYDLDTTSDSQLENVSTRGFVDVDDNVMIGGAILGGMDAQVLVRAIGPELTAKGVSGALQDTILELYDKDGAMIASNDDWKEEQQPEIEATTISPTDDRESAILATLPADSYTAIVRGKDNTTGVALVEMYNISP